MFLRTQLVPFRPKIVIFSGSLGEFIAGLIEVL